MRRGETRTLTVTRMSSRAEVIVRCGAWLYDKVVRRPVRVIRLTKDFWYDITKADGLLEPGERPELGTRGQAFALLSEIQATTHSAAVW